MQPKLPRANLQQLLLKLPLFWAAQNKAFNAINFKGDSLVASIKARGQPVRYKTIWHTRLFVVATCAVRRHFLGSDSAAQTQ